MPQQSGRTSFPPGPAGRWRAGVPRRCPAKSVEHRVARHVRHDASLGSTFQSENTMTQPPSVVVMSEPVDSYRVHPFTLCVAAKVETEIVSPTFGTTTSVDESFSPSTNLSAV